MSNSSSLSYWQVSLDLDVSAFALTFIDQTTAALLGTISGADLESGLDGLSNIGSGNATVNQQLDGSFVVTLPASVGIQPATLIGTVAAGSGQIIIRSIDQAEAT